MATGQSCFCAWFIWYLKSLSKCYTMGSSGVPCPWEHSVLFYSEDNKPKALTNGMDDPAPVGAWLLLSGTWELDTSLLCVTVLFYLASVVAAIRVPAFVLTDKAKVPAFLLLCSYCKPRINQEVVPKMKAHSSVIFWTMYGWCWIVYWWIKGCPSCATLCYNHN